MGQVTSFTHLKRAIVVFTYVLALSVSVLAQAASASTAFTGKLNVNTATVDELAQLPGIGASKAEAIVVYRTAHPFKTVEELLEVKGIGPKMFEAMKDHVKLDGVSDLAVASAPKAAAPAAARPQ